MFVRATDKAGTFTLEASAAGLASATATVDSKAITLEGGLLLTKQQAYNVNEITYAGGSGVVANNAAGASAAAQATATYTVTVNGKAVSFTEAPFRPDSSTGVLCELRPVLDALKAAGVTFSYSYQTSGDLPAYLASFKLPVLTLQADGAKRVDVANGETAIVVDSGADKNLTNAEFTVTAGGELVAELAAVLGYLPGVSVQTDSATCTVSITTK